MFDAKSLLMEMLLKLPLDLFPNTQNTRAKTENSISFRVPQVKRETSFRDSECDTLREK